MKIILVGPGIMPIPPTGWGAVELLIWDYYNILTSFGHEVRIINTPDKQEIIQLVNQHNADMVHLHYDIHWDIIPSLTTPVKIITSHYPYITDISKWNGDGYGAIVNGFRTITSATNTYVCCLNKSCMDTFHSYGIPLNRMFIMRNGMIPDNIRFWDETVNSEVICVAKLEPRKRQYLTQNIPEVVYVGKGQSGHPRFLAEWPRDKILNELTNYSGFVLLSTEENDSLALKEALVAGLPSIVSEGVVKNVVFDEALSEFICVIPEANINDEAFLRTTILEHIHRHKKNRNIIRKLAIQSFSLENILNKYIDYVKSIFTHLDITTT